MKTYFYRSICISAIMIYCCGVLSQIKNDRIVRFGGIILNTDRQQTEDNALFGVLYQFTQKAFEYSKAIIVTDTLLLVTGNSHSIFLDPFYKERLEISRKVRIERSKKVGRANIEHENVDEIADLIGVNSDYREENNGDPVQIYKDRSTGIVSSVYNAFVDNLICKQQIEAFSQWVITDKTDTVFNYPCKMAKTVYAGRNYTAWFTLEIPVSDGPWKFHGLPGLILRVEDDEKLFQYMAIGLQQYHEKTEIVKDNVKYENCTLRQFNSFVKREKKRNLVNFYSGGQLYMTYRNSPITYINMEIEE